MDSPVLDSARHLAALDALARVNTVSLSAGRVWAEVVRLSRQGVEPARVLDVACGGGDVLHAIARRARRHGTSVELRGCDLSSVALGRAGVLGGDALGVTFRQLDVLHDPLPSGHDVLCSLFSTDCGRPEHRDRAWHSRSVRAWSSRPS